MKRLSLLKKIALGSGVVAAVSPIALMSTSCAIEDIQADYIEFNSILQDKHYGRASVGSQSFKRLLFGSKKVCNGNYILFIGSNMSDAACKFYSGQAALRDRDNWFKTSTASESGHFNDGDFFLGIEKTAGTPIKNFGIFNVIDFWNRQYYDKKGHKLVVCMGAEKPTEIISPWAKWTDDMITQTKHFNKAYCEYEWDEKSVSTNEYIRNDDSAVRYRTFIHTALKVYPVTDKRKKSFDAADNSKNLSYMLVFVDGQLKSVGKDEKEIVDIQDMPSSYTSWFDTIKKFFEDKHE